MRIHFFSQGRCTMIHQPDKSRYCINMVYVSPVKRGMAEIIEDILPVYNIRLTLNVDKPVKRVYLGLTGQELDFTVDNEGVRFTVPELHCHTTVVVEYQGMDIHTALMRSMPDFEDAVVDAVFLKQ